MSELQTVFLAALRDGAAFIDSGGRRFEVARVDLGSLEIESGRIAIDDPLTGMDPAAPPHRTVAPGRYKVDNAVVRYPGGDHWVAAARLSCATSRLLRGSSRSWSCPPRGRPPLPTGGSRAGG